MKKIFIFFFFIINFVSTKSFAIEAEAGKWSFSKEENYCFILSLPLKEEGNYDPANRGDTYVMVYKINKNPDPVVQINAGYKYKNDSEIIMVIDNTSFKLFSEGDDSAWSEKEDKKIVYAMKMGQNMTIKGTSSRGNPTKDTYTLLGFTSAFKKLNDC